MVTLPDPLSASRSLPHEPMTRSSEIRSACELLDAAYGSPRHGNPTDPSDVLLYILLSNRTAPIVARRVYAQLRSADPKWYDLTTEALRGVLRPAGLAEKRAAHLMGIAERLRRDFGTVTLEPLRGEPDTEAEAYLCSLPGVSVKVSKCVLMYGFDRQVLPVDVHVHRITGRLGWHSHRRADQSHSTLEEVVPPELRYAFHVNCVAHGRAVCRASRPACGSCVLLSQCQFYQDLQNERAA